MINIEEKLNELLTKYTNEFDKAIVNELNNIVPKLSVIEMQYKIIEISTYLINNDHILSDNSCTNAVKIAFNHIQGIKNVPQSICIHEYVQYQGLSETYEYCKLCQVRK